MKPLSRIDSRIISEARDLFEGLAYYMQSRGVAFERRLVDGRIVTLGDGRSKFRVKVVVQVEAYDEPPQEKSAP